MDFGLLPPEINSARMYAGPGSAPMLAAAASWDSLAADLFTTVEDFQAVLLGLTTIHWRGPASVAMQSAALTQTRWLSSTAEQTKQTAMQARAAASAFEQAYAMTVPPAEVAANRAQLGLLLATNFLGQNTAAIAATEVEYAEMWAQDAAAMYGYAAGSAAATQLAPFTPPQQLTNAEGVAAQSAAVTEAASSLTARVGSLLPKLGSAVSWAVESEEGLLGQLPLGDIDAVDGIYSTFTGIQTCQSLVTGVIQAGKSAGLDTAASALSAQSLLPPLPTVSALGPGSGLAILAGANRIGLLAVPPSWAAPVAGPIAALSGSGLTTLPGTAELAGPGAGLPGVPFVSGSPSRGFGVFPRYGTHLTVMSRSPAAG